VSRAFFEEVAEALVGFLPPEWQGFSSRSTGRNLKVWFGAEAKEHYEVQLLAGERGRVLEVGFHAEHADGARNDEILERLLAGERRWRRALGPEVVTGRFLGRPGHGGSPSTTAAWRRASEVWDGPDLVGPEAAVEAADRLAAYICVFEPLRRV
jgi:hypothetical protein